MKQKAANVGTGCDVRAWHDRSAASWALGIAADALAALLATHRDEAAQRAQ